MTKVHIIGGPGSGKTYLGKKLSSLLDLPYLDLDTIFWDENAEKYGIKNPKEKRLELLHNFLKNKDYIIEGVYDSWLQESFQQAEYIIILNNHPTVRNFRIAKRFFLNKFKKTKTKQENIFDLIRMIKWNDTFQKEHAERILKLKDTYPEKTFIFEKTYTALEFILSKAKREK